MQLRDDLCRGYPGHPPIPPPELSEHAEAYSCFMEECFEGVLHYRCLYLDELELPIELGSQFSVSPSGRFALFSETGSENWTVVDSSGTRYDLGPVAHRERIRGVEWRESADRVLILIDGATVAEFRPSS